MIQNIIEKINRGLEKTPYIIAIDGQSASGKTMLAAELQRRCGGIVLHMDDFFLRPEQRTKERLSEIGGNVDYERFSIVLEQARANESVFYQPYSCQTGSLMTPKLIEPASPVIIEGAYSLHPNFGNYADLKIGLQIDSALQKERILQRNGREKLVVFLEEWIPKENVYLEHFHIFKHCDMVISASSLSFDND